jgi:hypothetical protein
LICVEGLSYLINKATAYGEVSDYRCRSTRPFISHLFFADGNLLFGAATDGNCRAIRHLLDVYTTTSDQTINYNKSALCVSRFVSQAVGNKLLIVLVLVSLSVMSDTWGYLALLVEINDSCLKVLKTGFVTKLRDDNIAFSLWEVKRFY